MRPMHMLIAARMQAWECVGSAELGAASSACPGRRLQLHPGKTAGGPAGGSWPAKSEAAEMS
jgi:hypothetical protein